MLIYNLLKIPFFISLTLSLLFFSQPGFSETVALKKDCSYMDSRLSDITVIMAKPRVDLYEVTSFGVVAGQGHSVQGLRINYTLTYSNFFSEITTDSVYIAYLL